MHRIRCLLPLATLFLAATCAFLAHQWVTTRHRLADLEAQLAARLDRPAAPIPTAAASRDTLHDATPGADKNTVTDSAQQRSRDRDCERLHDAGRSLVDRHELERALLNDPAYARLWQQQQKLLMRQMEPGLQRHLELSDAEFEALLEQRTRVALEQALHGPNPWNPDDARPGAPLVKPEIGVANERAMREMLGDARYQQLEVYQTQHAARREMADLQTGLCDAGLPLTPEQQRQLLPLIGEAGQRRQIAMDLPAAARQPPAPDDLQYAELEYRAGLESERWLQGAVDDILTPEQLRQLSQQLQHSRDLQKTSLQLQRLQIGKQGAGP